MTPAPITQQELSAYLDLHHAVDVQGLSFRRRIEAGAEVEPGPLEVELESIDEEDPQEVLPVRSHDNIYVGVEVRAVQREPQEV